jgi:hypothetical protein
MAKPWLTSDDLVETVKRNISMPVAQVTFSDDDILKFANQEMFGAQVPSILEHHEEYMVYEVQIPLEDDVSEYAIPDRAIGMKIRDLLFVDTNGNQFAMVDVGLSNADYYKTNFNNFQNPRNFYIQNDSFHVLPGIQGSTPGHFLLKYYLRPNSLVENDRALICTHFIKEITVDNSDLTAGDTLTVDGNELVAGTDFAIGVTSTATAANLATAIAALDDFEATSSSATVSVTYEDRNAEFESDSDGLVVSDELGIGGDSIPEHFETGMICDFLQTKGGHKTYDYDIEATNVSTDSVFFADSDVPTKFIVGDYICEENECIIPQIPSDLHNLLCERTCARILEALGDREGLAATNNKIAELEQRQATMIDNRMEGSPKKVFNRYSSLRAGKFRGYRRGSL